MDDDLNEMSRDALIEMVRRLRAGIRKHRDSTGHDLCWFHPHLWQLLPEALALPIFPELRESQLRAVVQSVADFYKQLRK